MKDNTRHDYTISVTMDEFLAMSELVRNMRAEQARKEAIEKCKMAISFEISNAISEIGLEETKRIFRELNREIREI